MCLGHREDGARPCQHIEEEEALGRATQEGVKALVCNAWGGEFTSSPAPRGGGTPRCGEEQELNFVGTWRRKVLEETGMLREAKGLPRRQMEEALGEKEFNLAGWKVKVVNASSAKADGASLSVEANQGNLKKREKVGER